MLEARLKHSICFKKCKYQYQKMHNKMRYACTINARFKTKFKNLILLKMEKKELKCNFK